MDAASIARALRDRKQVWRGFGHRGLAAATQSARFAAAIIDAPTRLASVYGFGKINFRFRVARPESSKGVA